MSLGLWVLLAPSRARMSNGQVLFSLGMLLILLTGSLFALTPAASGNSGSDCPRGDNGYCSSTSNTTTGTYPAWTTTCTRTVSSASTISSTPVPTVTLTEIQTVTSTAPPQTLVETQTLTQPGSTLTVTEPGTTGTQTLTQTISPEAVIETQTTTETTSLQPITDTVSGSTLVVTQVQTETLPGQTEIVTQPGSVETVTQPGPTVTVYAAQGGGIITVTVKQQGLTTTDIQQVTTTSQVTLLLTVVQPYAVTATELLKPITTLTTQTSFVGSTLTLSPLPQVVVKTLTTTHANTVAVQGPAANALSNWFPWLLILVALCIGVLVGYRVKK